MKVPCPTCHSEGFFVDNEGHEVWCTRCDGRKEVEDFIAEATLDTVTATKKEGDTPLHTHKINKEMFSDPWIIRVLQNEKGNVVTYFHHKNYYDPKWPDISVGPSQEDKPDAVEVQLDARYFETNITTLEGKPLYILLDRLEKRR